MVISAPGTETGAAKRRRPTALRGHRVLPIPAVLWLAILFLVPVGILLSTSFLSYEGPDVVLDPNLGNYSSLFSDSHFLRILWSTVWTSLAVAFICAVMAYPVAHFLVRSNSRIRVLVVVLVLSPMVASVVVRTYGWLVLLEKDGLISQVLEGTGIHDGPTGLRGTYAAIIIGLVHVLLPFSVFTTMSSLQAVNPSLEQAARDLGAGPVRTFFRVTLPLSLPGVTAGAILVFAICLGAFATPSVLGGGRVQTLATLVQEAMITTGEWARAASVAAVILALGLSVILVLSWSARLTSRGGRPEVGGRG
ncbi:putative spermidine/putrescine transport system permease protein [Actinomadura madurae]|uniref:Putative spermidine/putrescine transport system permease protein n=1 Tax=Actinomadura madurae TaxID=1993 RepID=A0A1I5F7P3_9ACTN|nr:putative spermidine/putrescine transport system permease protein [Actinomadura madurae]